jgi:MinD-like ATPase involved in chromosome partitioning or flagellar assembly
VKGGSGTTVVAASLALLAASAPDGALLVDFAGDAAAALGLPEPAGPGLCDWLAAGADVGTDALEHLSIPAAAGLRLLPIGCTTVDPVPTSRFQELARHLRDRPEAVVADLGVLRPALAPVLGRADASLLVLRPCYLALRRAHSTATRPTGIVLVTEPGRALGRRDVEEVIGVRVLAEVDVDPTVARAVDAGLLGSRLPRSLRVLRAAA